MITAAKAASKSNIRQSIHLLLELQEFLVILWATIGENKQ